MVTWVIGFELISCGVLQKPTEFLKKIKVLSGLFYLYCAKRSRLWLCLVTGVQMMAVGWFYLVLANQGGSQLLITVHMFC